MTVYPLNKPVFRGLSFNLFLTYVTRHYPAHRHDCLELSLVIDGEGYQNINGVRHEMRAGTYTFLLPHHIHDIYTTSSVPLRMYNCMFEPSFLFRSSGGGHELEALITADKDWPPSFQATESDYDSLKSMFAGTLQEFEREELWRDRLLRIRLEELLIRFERLRRRQADAATSSEHVRATPIWPVLDYIQLHYRDPLSLSELAERFGMNHCHLSKQFKKLVGQTFIRFVHELRIRHACSLLLSTTMSGVEIAIEVGFGSFKSFARAFAEIKGTTPTDYRKRYQPVMRLVT